MYGTNPNEQQACQSTLGIPVSGIGAPCPPRDVPQMEVMIKEFDQALYRYADLLNRLEQIRNKIHGPQQPNTSKMSAGEAKTPSFKESLATRIMAINVLNDGLQRNINELDIF